MDSGSVSPAEDVTMGKAQTVYNTVVANAGCAYAADTLACLCTVPYPTYLAAANSVSNIFSVSKVLRVLSSEHKDCINL